MSSRFVSLLVAILFWAISLFLVGEAAKSQKWVLGGPGGMPEPHSGVAMSQLLSCLFILLWLARVYFLSQPPPNPARFIPQLLINPERLTPGILLAVFPPLVVGGVKLATAMVVSRGEMENRVERHNRLCVTAVFLVLHVAIAAAAAVMLSRAAS